ncbi:hypothetical protein BBAD15_g4413 [Beauveria bassiana D1-5]|uniref:Aminoglycoside phosphotransferase domain-containing protein n=1 Tax=Beauveria bassiana D1-5 TaxID=1245745 RepID=A0A0A2VV71_BEABA|nr:hypothetical protein BBAD15_g4413 [Beauveria bassiana D1-5]
MPSSIPPPSIPQVASLLQYDILFSEPDDSLPEPLPTTIEVIEDAPTIHKLQSRCIARVGTSYAVKYGYAVELLEAENMKFVRQNTNIYVPRVYAVYQRFLENGKHQKTYIIMERIAGESLDKMWDGFDTTAKLAIIQKLKETFISLRDLPHDGFFGSLDKTKLRDFLFVADEPMPAIDSPFNTEEALIEGVLDRFLAEDPDRLRHKAAYYRQVLSKVFKGNGQPVFTHADLQLKNIMLQPDGRIVIIDWAASGWYPVYWEYSVAVCAHKGWLSDWHTYIGLFLDEYPNHFAWMSRLRMERWF